VNNSINQVYIEYMADRPMTPTTKKQSIGLIQYNTLLMKFLQRMWSHVAV